MFGGEIFILKMPSIRLEDLADIFTKKYHPRKKIKIKYIGNRAGDKLHEALLGSNDSNKETWVNNEMLILVPTADIHNLVSEPRSYEGFKKITTDLSFSSENYLDTKKIERIV
mgnify:FL=1